MRCDHAQARAMTGTIVAEVTLMTFGCVSACWRTSRGLSDQSYHSVPYSDELRATV